MPGASMNRVLHFIRRAVTPTAGASGVVTITLTVQDSDGATATETFVLTVEPPAPPSQPIGSKSENRGQEPPR